MNGSKRTDICLVVNSHKIISPIHGSGMRTRPKVGLALEDGRARSWEFRKSAYMIKLHMARKSLDQYSIGPRGVDAQSMERANWICLGSEEEIDKRVQSKKPTS